jgi:PAS domain S-box-containing protein
MLKKANNPKGELKKSKPAKPTTKKANKNILGFDIILQSILDKTIIGILLLDSRKKILRANKAFQKIVGYNEKELTKLTVKDFNHPHDYKLDSNLFSELITGKRNDYEVEKRYISKDGKIKFVRINFFRINDEHDKNCTILALIEDISEQKQISEKLASEQNYLSTLLDNIPDSIYFKDLKSRFVKTNTSIAQKHGCPNPEMLIGKTDADIFGPEHTAEAYADEQQIIKTGLPIIGKEEREDWPDGRTTWVYTTKMPFFDSKKKIIGTFGISHDITERKINEERIAESEQLYRSLFESSEDGILLMSDGVIIDCNQAILRIFKCTRDYVIGHPISDISPIYQPDGTESQISANEYIELAFDGQPQHFAWQHKRADNALVDCDISIKSVIIKGKKIIQAHLHDITQKKKAERIREGLFEISEAAYTASDMYTLYKKIHEAIGKLMPTKNIYIARYDEKTELLSFPYFVDEYDPPQPPKKLGKGLTEYVLRHGQPLLVNAEKDLQLRKSGEVELIGAPQAIWLGVPLKLSGKNIGVIVVQDYENEKAYSEEEMQILTFVSEQVAQVIERKRSSDEIAKYAEELKQLNTTKDKFFSIIAHDLKNPFITLLGFSDLLLSDFAEISDDEKIYYITEMKKSAEASHSLLQNLLQWSRSQTGRIEFNPQNINLQNLVYLNSELIRASAEKKHIEVLYDIPQDIFVFADEEMLKTIIRNLLTNALKFTDNGGKIGVAASLKENHVEFCVSDTGIGMDEPAKNSLFRLDSSHSTAGTENETGTGLGLILCKEFIEKHGCKIWVESELKKGSEFFFTLPLAK